jgi:hypothetical protein
MSDSLADLFLAASDAINAPAAARAAARKPVVLPGEDPLAVAAVAQLRADAAEAGQPVSLADLFAREAGVYRRQGDRAHQYATRRIARMRQAIDAELAQD